MTPAERLKAWFPRPVRLWLYGVGVAVFGLLLVYGIVNLQQAGAWLLVLGAALGLQQSGMAALNTRRPKPPLD